MARKTAKRRYAVHARKCLDKIRSWMEKGNPNVIHYESLLEAENWALKGKTFVAKKHYLSATVLATRGGFIQDAAMANERFGEFLLEDMGEPEEAAYQFKQAAKLYEEWGAQAKADEIVRNHGHLWSLQPSEVVIKGSVS